MDSRIAGGDNNLDDIPPLVEPSASSFPQDMKRTRNSFDTHAIATDQRGVSASVSKPIDIQPPKTALGAAAASLSATARSFMANPTLNATRVPKKTDTAVESGGEATSQHSVADSKKLKGLKHAEISESGTKQINADTSPLSSSSNSSQLSGMSANELYTYAQHALHQADEDDEWQNCEKIPNGIDSEKVLRPFTDEFSSGTYHQQQEMPTFCLFCEQTLPTPQLTLKHLEQMHNVDLVQCCRTLDELEYIRLVNYIRREQVSPELLSNGVICMPKTAWNQDVYLMPVVVDDPMLTLLIAGNDTDIEGNPNGQDTVSPSSFPLHQNALIDKLDGPHKFAEQMTTSASALSLLEKNSRLLGTTNDDDFADNQRAYDDGYFATYSHFGIHEEMLKDEIRTRGYMDIITLLRTSYIENRTVLDVGCGTCILSAFAVRAGGARKVFAVDQADIVSDAFDILNENGNDLVERIEIIRSTIEQVQLSATGPNQKPRVDVIISEWMGYFLLFESMLESVLHARDRFLARNPSSVNNFSGLLIPNRATMYMSLLSDPDRYSDAIGYWDNVYGVKMSRIKRLRLKTPEVGFVSEATVVSGFSVVLKQFDLTTMQPTETEFESFIRLPVQKQTTEEKLHANIEEKNDDPVVVITALAGWFDVSVVLPQTEDATSQILPMFSTSPAAPDTHWKQTIFYLPQPLSLNNGSALVARVRINKHPKDRRALLINITLWQDELVEPQAPENYMQTNWLARKPLLEVSYDML